MVYDDTVSLPSYPPFLPFMVTLFAEDGLLELLAGVPVLLGERVPHPLDQLPHEVVLQGRPLTPVTLEVRLDQGRQVSAEKKRKKF